MKSAARAARSLVLRLALAPLLIMATPACVHAAGSPAYSLTTAACVSGKPFGAAGQTCAPFPAAPLTAGAPASFYVTALVNGVPTAPSAASDTPLAASFALGCINPATGAGVQASVAGVNLPPCAANGVAPANWSTAVPMVFRAGAASVAAAASFVYADVGKLTLMLRDGGGQVAASGAFVVKPAMLKIIGVTRNADGAAMASVSTGADSGFTRVGEAFTINAAALTASGAVAPNFGSEGALLTLAVAAPADSATRTAMRKLPGLGASGFTRVVGGVFSGSAFAADELGIVALTPRLATQGVADDYLGAGSVPAASLNVGRFYPDHFDTELAATGAAAMACLPHMACPAAVTAVAYSGQPFALTVKPMGADGAALLNYNGVLARAVTLSAWRSAGASDAASANPGGGALSANSVAAGAPLTANPVYTLPNGWSASAPRAARASAPAAIWLRADAVENTVGGSATVSSARAGAQSAEAGIEIVAGRLGLGQPYGSELLKMPVRLEAQYFTAAGRWELAAMDNASTINPAAISFADCTRQLGPPCRTTLLAPASSAPATLARGVATFWLRAPGAGNEGSAAFRVAGPAWLPSTVGRAVFGLYRSPLIYVREKY